LKLIRSNTFQIDIEAEKKSQMKPLKKKVLYNPLSYFKRSNTFDCDETEYNINLKQEIKRVLDRNFDKYSENSIVSLSELDSEKTVLPYKEEGFMKNSSSDLNLSTKTFLYLPTIQSTSEKLDIFLKFLKDFKITIPIENVKVPITKISIGINTSKAPSPINNGKYLNYQQPNFLESALGFNNNLMIVSNQQVSFLPYLINPMEQFYLNPMMINNGNQIFNNGYNQTELYSHNNVVDKNFLMMGGRVIIF